MPWFPTLAARLLALSIILAPACRPVNTVPAPLKPEDPVQRYDLEIPRALEIRAVDFSATTFSDVSGGRDWTGTSVGGRAFLKVYAVHRETGEQYLLIYENLAKRKRPIQVIRFRPAAGDSVLAPGR